MRALRRRRGVGSVAGKATAEAVADNLRPLPEASHTPTSIPPRHLRHIRVQYVAGFDVAVRHAHPVQVRQRSSQLCRQRSRLRWRHPLAPDPMPGHPPLQRAPPTVFEQDGRGLVRLEQLHHVGDARVPRRLQRTQHLDLGTHQAEQLLVAGHLCVGESLDGHFGTRAGVHRSRDHREGARRNRADGDEPQLGQRVEARP